MVKIKDFTLAPTKSGGTCHLVPYTPPAHVLYREDRRLAVRRQPRMQKVISLGSNFTEVKICFSHYSIKVVTVFHISTYLKVVFDE